MANDKGDDMESHVKKDLLVLFAEGELPMDTITSINRHLTKCSVCSAELKEITDGIVEYESFYRTVYSQQFPPPPNAWRAFEAKLAASLPEEHSSNRIQILQMSEAPRIKLFSQRLILSFSVVAAVAALVAFLFLQDLSPKANMSAGQIITIAKTIQAKDLRAMQRPVVYQRVKIKKTTAGQSPEAIILETWHDVENARLRETVDTWSQLVEEGNSHQPARFPASIRQKQDGKDLTTHADLPRLVSEIRAIYKDNDFRDTSPISLNEFSRWSSSLPNKIETVQELVLAGNAKAYRITAETEGPIATHTLRALQITVRANDWHTIQENLVVASENATQTYEIAELDYRVLPFAKTNMSIWSTSSIETVGQPVHLPTTKFVSRPETEGDILVDALAKLDAIDVLTDDQITFERINGILRIHGRVPSDTRKTAVLAALAPLSHFQNVNIDIRSTAEMNQQHELSRKPLETQSIDVSAKNVKGNPDLRRYLRESRHLSGSALDDEMQHFTTSVFAQSSRVREDAAAVRLLVTSIPVGAQNMLSAKSFEQWRTLVVRHASNAEQQAGFLYKTLSRIGPPSVGTLSNTSNVQSDDLRSQAMDLYKLAGENDRKLWDVFAPAAENTQVKTILDVGLLRSLSIEARTAGAIARAINENKRP